MKPVVGLIGGIGSGKSAVAALFAARGARVIAADQLGHEALTQPDVRAQVVGRWGTGVLDEQGNISRRRLGQIVFADPAERRALEAMVFPWIERRIREELAAAQADPKVPLIVVDAAIMLEAGWNTVCNWLVYIEVSPEVRRQRLAAQRGWSEKEVHAREAAQMPLPEKKHCADYVVDNSGTPEETVRQVEDLLSRWGVARA
jgi:dephospho-CoA kinase